MIPVEIMGHSFKGVISYLAQGKKGTSGGAEKRRMVYTKNMEELAPRNWKEVYAIMTRYASEDIRRGLMQVANVRGCAREINAEKPIVRHIILAFPSGAQPRKGIVKRAVHEALSSLTSVQKRTLADHQYAVFLHEDTDNWHVHIVVNMVDHRTGRLADPYRSQQKLQRWAYNWCKRHNFDVCKNRQAKYERIERKCKAASSSGKGFKDYSGHQNFRGDQYHLYQLRQKRGAGGNVQISGSLSREALEMRKWCRRRYESRRREWQELDADIKQKYSSTVRGYKQKISEAVRLEDSPMLFSLHWWQRLERRYFFLRERYVLGRVINALLYAGYMSGNGYSKNLWHLLLNMQSRRLAMFRQQYSERIQSPKVKHVERQRNVALSKLKIDAQTRKAALRSSHSKQRGQEAWEWKLFNYKRYPSQIGLNTDKNANDRNGTPKRTTKRYAEERYVSPHTSLNMPSA